MVYLGNVRLTYADTDGNGSINPSSEIISEKNYYPFGLEHKGYNYVVSANANSVAQKFKFNGIELEESLGADIYEMPFRQYDPAIARFTSIDPVDHYDYSTYTAFDNNPVFWADPSGADGEHYNWDTERYENDQGEEVSFDTALASATSNSPNDVIHIDRKRKTYTVTEAEGDDIIYGDGERRTAERGVTQANLIEEGFEQREAPEGVGMGAVDGAALFLTGEAAVAWAIKGIRALWALRGAETIATPGSNVVYTSVSNGVTQYAGITNNFARRSAEHLASKGINIQPLMKGLSRTDARSVEQALIEIHGLGKNGGTLLNKINSISTKNPVYGESLQRGYELLKTIGY